MPKKFYEIDPIGLYYKHVTIINDDSGIVSKCGFKLIDDARVIIYNRSVFIIQTSDCIDKIYIKGESLYRGNPIC
jgi:hypothetical protein